MDEAASELIAAENSPVTKKPLVKLAPSFTGKIIIGSVFREDSWQTAIGNTHIRSGDKVIAICGTDYLKDLNELFL